jgi:hypothetical protein
MGRTSPIVRVRSNRPEKAKSTCKCHPCERELAGCDLDTIQWYLLKAVAIYVPFRSGWIGRHSALKINNFLYPDFARDICLLWNFVELVSKLGESGSDDTAKPGWRLVAEMRPQTSM